MGLGFFWEVLVGGFCFVLLRRIYDIAFLIGL